MPTSHAPATPPRRRRWLAGLARAGVLGAAALAAAWCMPPLRRAVHKVAPRAHRQPPDSRPTRTPVAADRVDLHTLAADARRGRLLRGDWAGLAELNAALAQEAFARADRTARAWLGLRSPELGLLPRALRLDGPGNQWAYRDCAADLYGHLVIAGHLLDADLLPALRSILTAERRLDDGLPRGVDLATGQPLEESVEERLYGAVEYAKDGLLPIAERVGAPEWNDRLDEVVTRILAHSTVASEFGPLPSAGAEKNGEMLQVLARLFQRDGRPEHLEAGRRIADAYCREVLPGNGGVPAHQWDFVQHRAATAMCKLRDHGNEMIAGLVEWVAAELAAPDGRAAIYRPAVERMLDVLLERGRSPAGLWLNAFDPSPAPAAETLDRGALNDTWGYVSSALVAYALTLPADHPLRERLVATARETLRAVTALRSALWEWGRPDGYADTLEGALYLLEYLADPEAELWVDREIGVLFAYQQDDGFVDSTYLDGNFVRTALLYGLFRTAGIVPEPWLSALRVGAQRAPDGLYVHVESAAAWQGRLRFDVPRHRELMRLAMPYPRLNGWPEWFVAEPGARYRVLDLDSGETHTVGGAELRAGLPLAFAPSGSARLRVRRLP